MAKRMKSKIQPAVQKMFFTFNTGAAGAIEKRFIDLSQCASILNRRFYRQGLNWAVSSIRLWNDTVTNGGSEQKTTGKVQISKLPNTWVMSNSWEKAFRAYMRMIKQVTSESESLSRPKFLDFKIYANEDHFDKTSSANLLPTDADGNTANAGEWVYSRFEIPTGELEAQVPPALPTAGVTAEFDIVAVGPNYGSAGNKNIVSLVNGYANSRALPNLANPHTPDDMDDTIGPTPENWMTAIFNEGTEQSKEVLADLEVHYNEHPYPMLDQGGATTTMYPGGETQLPGLEIVDFAYITGTTIGSQTLLQGSNFPCGLIEILTQFDQTTVPLGLEVTLVPGTHRGYLAESMTEM